MIERLGMENF
jgi:hypothetical protein